MFSIVKEWAYNCKFKKQFALKICKIRLENPMENNTCLQAECTKIRHMPMFKERKSETARWLTHKKAQKKAGKTLQNKISSIRHNQRDVFKMHK